MNTFNWSEYIKSGHLEPYYSAFNGLTYTDLHRNPYGFSGSILDDKDISQRIAKMIARKYCQSFAVERVDDNE